MDEFLLRTTECADRKRKIENGGQLQKNVGPPSGEQCLFAIDGSEFLVAWPTFCAGLSGMLLRLCLIPILNTFRFIMQ